MCLSVGTRALGTALNARSLQKECWSMFAGASFLVVLPKGRFPVPVRVGRFASGQPACTFRCILHPTV